MRGFQHAWRSRAAAGLLALAAGSSARAQSNGIFADFSTSLGNFTVQLDYERAPRAVAAFVGLATGTGSWLDAQSNLWHMPFYDGSLFHRVVKDAASNGIAIQGGGIQYVSVDTNGVATTNFANAGYTMLESVTNGLAHTVGALALANSGPNTDGSQFFIMATNWPAWDGNYSVFGHVTAGMDAVAAIAAVPVQGTGSRPVQDVVLSNVVVHRVGAAAAAFDITAQGVPVPEAAPMRVYGAGANLAIEIEVTTQSKPLLLSASPDMLAWERNPYVTNLVYYTGSTTVLTGQLDRASLGNRHFFHAGHLRFPVPITAPASNRGRFFTFWWNTSPSVKYEVLFAPSWQTPGQYRATTDGTNVSPIGTVFIGDMWTNKPYSSALTFVDDTGMVFSYSLGFNPGQPNNRFTGSWWTLTNAALRQPFAGVFTVQ